MGVGTSFREGKRAWTLSSWTPSQIALRDPEVGPLAVSLGFNVARNLTSLVPSQCRRWRT